MKLYDNQSSGNCWKVRQILALLEIPYERVELDVIDRSNRAEVLGGKNPALRVPTLEFDDGQYLAEAFREVLGTHHGAAVDGRPGPRWLNRRSRRRLCVELLLAVCRRRLRARHPDHIPP